MSRSTNDDHDDANPRAGSSPAVPSVRLIVRLDARREQVTRAIARIAPLARIETARSAFGELLRGTRDRPADLLVLDLTLDGPAAPALTRHLARIGQPTTVLVFDDVGQSLPDEACDVWPWSEMGTVLRRWFDEWQRRGAAPE